MPQSHTYENVDFPELQSAKNPSNNPKLFATSTTEIFERKPLFRSSSSLLSSHSSGSSFGSSSCTINSSNSASSSSGLIYPGGSSTMEISQNPTNSIQQGQGQNDNHHPNLTRQGSTQSRRISLTSDARFSEYLSSTSSWDCEWEDDDEFPDTKDGPVVFPYRRLSNAGRNSSSGSGTSKVSSIREEKIRSSVASSGYFSELEVTVKNVHDKNKAKKSNSHVKAQLGTENQREVEPEPSTSRLAAAGIFRASCPSLNTIDRSMVLPANDEFRRKLRDRHADDFPDISVSTVFIGPPKTDEVNQKPGKSNAGKFLGTSKSSGCLASVNVKGLNTLFLNRPITLRFTPSGLTESHRVVWISETGNHPGIVKWVGKIRGTLYAGVEFEKAVGNSSGIYGYGHGLQTRLFTCKLGYGRFIPVDQLILYEDFYENQKTGFICIICRDDFIEPGQLGDLNLPEKIMVATKCGHLFHHKCLNQWFNEKSAAFQHCPYCQFPMERNDTIRIFPAQVK